ncbi:hypothetical protein OAM78_06475 [Alphaproteobacteria bacterium]|nr:hypothetical protein [Alphaproteobacteria bacterium]
MASRPIFLSSKSNQEPVFQKNVEFEWVRGRSKVEKRKSIENLHKAGNKLGIQNILEVSTKSEQELGVSLSAFNLKSSYFESKFSVECVYQSSKVFLNAGPFSDILYYTSSEAKQDRRLTESGELISFELNGLKWSNQPSTLFYDWIYINAVAKRHDLCEKLIHYWAFTDIEFNPSRQINCQARSLALMKSFISRNKLDEVLKSPEAFLDHYPATIEPQGCLDFFSV